MLLNVAVVGEPGSGKSSFINSMLGKCSGDPGAAETGIQMTTTKAKAYPHPTLPQVVLWDLPGREESFGSRTDQEDLKLYDFFIIVGYQRFRTIHAELVHDIQAMGKRFYFVRAKTDLDVQASRRRQPSGYDDEKVLQRIKEDCTTCLLRENVNDPQVFLVSNWDAQSFDFPLLREKLQSDLLWLKEEASLRSHSKSLLENKGKNRLTVLYSWVWGLLCLPGLLFKAAVFFLMGFCSQCYQSFGLVRALAIDKPVAVLKAAMDLLFTIHYKLRRCLTAITNYIPNILSRVLKGKEKMSV